MGLTSGTRLGGYEVLAPIGRGGMGEVYRARDLTLQRDVAIKVLPEALAADPDRLSRFAREARLLAALNHPHIAGIHGFEEANGVRALVLELVEGRTLAERIREGPVEPVEATTIALQIADALDAAHEKGIIHRDLKPANIKLTAEGAVKVLDFGLAKALHDEADGGQTATVTVSGTSVGTVLGTAAYMSPEQARGQQVDRRTDIWAFGCVLYELLTGRSPFAGDTVSDTVAAILNREPDWNALPDTTPLHLRTLLRRCLVKDPRRRLRDIGDARLELESPAQTTDTHQVPSPASRRRWRTVATIGAIATLAALAVWGWSRPGVSNALEPVRVMVRLAPGTTVTRGPQYVSSVALSPDGRLLVIAGKDASGQRLYRRPLGELEPAPLAGTEGGSSPFFSPDGQWIGFFAADRLKRVPAGGGAPLEIAAAAAPQIPRGASWLPDDRIVFGSGAFTPLQIVSASGGTPELLTALDAEAGEISHSDPHILPDGRTLLFVVSRQGDAWIDALDLRTNQRTRIVEGFAPRYAAGHLVLSRGSNLLAAPWDSSRRSLGQVRALVEGVATEATRARHVGISPDGTLAYVPAAHTHALVLRRTDGTERGMGEVGASFENPQFSPRGDRVVVAASRRFGEGSDLWTHDLQTGAVSRLTFDGGRAPVWIPDGTAVTYSHLGEQPGIYTRSSDGQGAARRIVALDVFHWLVGWTPDARTLSYGAMEESTADGKSLSSIFAVTGGQSRRVVGPGSIWGGRLSPDGRWLAYYTLEPSGFEVYVTPFPGGGARWLVAEGTDPSWSPDGDEIFYRSGDRLMAARVDDAAGVRALSHRVAIEPFSPPGYDDYDTGTDGTLVLVRPLGDAVGREVTMVLNWSTELRRLSASGRR